MTVPQKGLALLAAQLLLVGSVAGKYAWERHTCPRVWTRATQYDPEQPLRGRYLALNLHADACALPTSASKDPYNLFPRGNKTSWTWEVLPRAKKGRLTAELAEDGDDKAQTLALTAGLPCEYARFTDSTEFFIAEHAKTPFPLPKGQELWAEVTVPPSGPPRPIRLAVSDGTNFRVLDLH